MAGLLWLKAQGLEVKNVEPFDYNRFVKEGGQYLIDVYGEEVGNAQIKHTDIEQERLVAKSFVNEIETVRDIPSVEDLRNLLLGGYLIICNINSNALNDQLGYVGHFVVIKGFDNDHLFLHDPGFPAFENRKVKIDLFEMSWAYPDENAKNVMAFRDMEML